MPDAAAPAARIGSRPAEAERPDAGGGRPPPPGPTGPLENVPLLSQFQKLIQSLTGSSGWNTRTRSGTEGRMACVPEREKPRFCT